MSQGELFAAPPKEITTAQLKTLGLKEADETWVNNLSESDRPAGLMWLEWKKENFKIQDKLSRPQLFMEGYQLGLAFMEHTKEKPSGDA